MAKGGDRKSPLRSYAVFSGMGLQFASCVLIGLFGGKWFDSHLGTTPWLMLLGLMLGLAAAVWGTVLLARQLPGDSR